VEPQRFPKGGEQAGAVADRHRMDNQPVLVDQTLSDQRVDERRAAVGEDDTPGLALQPDNLLREVSAGDSALGQSALVSVRENTTLGISFITSAYTPVVVGHTAAMAS